MDCSGDLSYATFAMSNSDRQMSNFKRYAVAVVAAGSTFGIVVLLADALPFAPLLLFAIPVALTSRYGGRGPTILTVLLSVIAISALPFITPELVGRTYEPLLLHAGMFGVVAFVIDSSTEALRKARSDAERDAERLEEFNVELEQQMDQIQMLSEDLQRSNQSLAKARDAAEEASRARAEMLAVVAHDLRNPLNLVMVTTELLAETKPSEERRDQLLDVMQRAAGRMNRLIEDLLEVVRQESGQLKLDVQQVSASSLTAQTAEMFQTTAMERGISLRVEECPPELAVRADGERIIQVMSNLVGNALKFVPRGGSVTLKCEPASGEVLFSVVDSGPGIGQEDIGRLFEKFWQRRRSDRRGVGLGLSIARGIVEVHGGRIWAESQLGVGSTFHFTLPAAIRFNNDPLTAIHGNADGLVSREPAPMSA